MPKDEDKEPAIKAAAAEAKAEQLTVEFGGNEYTVERDAQSSIEFLEALEDNKSFGMVRALLGRTQWAQFKLRHKAVSEFNDFVDAYGKVNGSGNS